MATGFVSEIESVIEAAAATKFGAVRVSIVRQVVRENLIDAGEWYVLSIDRGDGEWEVLGRRRTRQELMQLVSH